MRRATAAVLSGTGNFGAAENGNGFSTMAVALTRQ
jgi:hypothetical protein